MVGERGESVPIEELLAHAGWLKELARSLTHDTETADDVAQETWVSALRHPPQEAGSHRPWLARVAANIARNLKRSDRRRAEHETVAREARSSFSPEEVAPDRIAEEAEAQRLVAEKVRALPEPLRTVVVLRYFRGHNAGQIAQMIGVPAGTVRWRLKQALEHLRLDLDRAHGDERERWVHALAPLAIGRTAGARAADSLFLPLLGGLAMKRVALAIACIVIIGLVCRQVALVGPPASITSVPASPSPTQGTALETAEAVLPDSGRTPVTRAQDGAAEFAGSLVVHARWSDGSRAPGIGLIVRRQNEGLAERHVECLTTDEGGTARMEIIQPGSVLVEGDRGGQQEAEVPAGKETEVVLQIPAGIDLEGTVTDLSGQPIAGAEIVLVAPPLDESKGQGRNWLTTRVVARSDAGGNYRVRSAGEVFSLTARFGNYLPAELAVLEGKRPGERHRVDFVLVQPSLALRGIALDQARHPVAGACVAVGESEGMMIRYADGRLNESFGMFVARTGEDGTFSASGVRQANGLEMSVAVMAEGFPIWTGAVAGDLGALSFMEIVLDEPAAIEGVVRDLQGAPVKGASVDVQTVAARHAREIPFPLPHARTEADGTYRLDLVPQGRVEVRIEAPEDEGCGHGFGVATVKAGETTKLDVILPLDDTIRGRAEDAAGQPLIKHEVQWWSAYTAASRTVTDEQGRFALPGCDRPPYSVRLHEPGVPTELLQVDGATPGEELVLVAPDFGSASGVFVDTGGRIHASTATEDAPATGKAPWTDAGLQIFLSERHGLGARSAEYSDEGFAFSRLPPGVYRLTNQSRWEPRLPVGLVLAPPGRAPRSGHASERAGGIVGGRDPARSRDGQRPFPSDSRS